MTVPILYDERTIIENIEISHLIAVLGCNPIMLPLLKVLQRPWPISKVTEKDYRSSMKEVCF